ncbi:MAG: SRPBCC domain-containing protein [Cellulophaga sp.]
MEKSMIIRKVVEFNTTKKKVWDLLTNPEMTKQYMFGCEVLSEWTIGSQIIWKGKTEDGQEIIHVKGEITEVENGKKVSFTMLDPNMGIKDIPENYVDLTYEVSESESGATFKLTQDFEGTENAEKRYEESIGGWDMVIDVMKKLVDEKSSR